MGKWVGTVRRHPPDPTSLFRKVLMMNQTRIQEAMERNRLTGIKIVEAFALIGKAAKRCAEQMRVAIVSAKKSRRKS